MRPVLGGVRGLFRAFQHLRWNFYIKGPLTNVSPAQQVKMEPFPSTICIKYLSGAILKNIFLPNKGLW